MGTPWCPLDPKQPLTSLVPWASALTIGAQGGGCDNATLPAFIRFTFREGGCKWPF